MQFIEIVRISHHWDQSFNGMKRKLSTKENRQLMYMNKLSKEMTSINQQTSMSKCTSNRIKYKMKKSQR